MDDHSNPKHINITGRKRDYSSFHKRYQRFKLSNYFKEFKELLEEDKLVEARDLIYYLKKETFRLRLMKSYKLARNYEDDLAKKEANLTHPSLLNKANSLFYKEEDKYAKFHYTVAIFLALKKDFLIPNEEESDDWVADYTDNDLFKGVLAKRVKYLLMSIGFTESDIPRFQFISDDFECQDDTILDLHKELIGDYYFMIIDGYTIYSVWKLCDFLHSNRLQGRKGMRYISYEDIVEKPKQLVGDKLYFLYFFFYD